jgi:hypothetical protein
MIPPDYGKITLETVVDQSSGEIRALLNRTAQWVVNTQDEHVRAALIQLGWTPPDALSVKAWLHTINHPDFEGAEDRQWVTLTKDHEWGIPGKDFSAEYTPTSEPLYAAPPAKPEPSSPMLRRSREFWSQQTVDTWSFSFADDALADLRTLFALLDPYLVRVKCEYESDQPSKDKP